MQHLHNKNYTHKKILRSKWHPPKVHSKQPNRATMAFDVLVSITVCSTTVSLNYNIIFFLILLRKWSNGQTEKLKVEAVSLSQQYNCTVSHLVTISRKWNHRHSRVIIGLLQTSAATIIVTNIVKSWNKYEKKRNKDNNEIIVYLKVIRAYPAICFGNVSNLLGLIFLGSITIPSLLSLHKKVLGLIL